jgi:multicomponent Na+:H+ antiporter subunit B
VSTLILRTAAPAIAVLMAIFSIVVLLRGHNAPGGGFIGGLIAASAAGVWGMAFGVGSVRRVLRFNPAVYAAIGLLIAAGSGLLSLAASEPFLTGLWLPGYLFGVPGLFDVGVYVVVAGTLSAVALALEDSGEAQ